MTATTRLVLTAGFFGALASAGEQSITVHLHDYVGVPPAELSEAQEVATAVLAAASVGVEWRQAQVSAILLPPPGLTEFVIRLLPEPPAGQTALPRAVLGYVQPTPEGRRRWLASIYYERAGRMAKAVNCGSATLLGYAIAHELGHLLIGPANHSLTGLMRCPWNTPELKEAARGRLRFIPDQARLMQSNLDRVRQGR